MKNLGQAVYEDDNGREFPAEKVDCLAPYTHIADGFYHWTCGSCGEEHSDRWWSISGRVVKCGDGRSEALGEHRILPGCGKMNLLVRTNTKDITEALGGKWRQAEIAQENERLKDVVKWNDEQFRKIKADVMNAVEQTLSAARMKLGL
jgi:hypothetical protein